MYHLFQMYQNYKPRGHRYHHSINYLPCLRSDSKLYFFRLRKTWNFTRHTVSTDPLSTLLEKKFPNWNTKIKLSHFVPLSVRFLTRNESTSKNEFHERVYTLKIINTICKKKKYILNRGSQRLP